MPIYKDKKSGCFVFEFSRYIDGRRVRTRKLLPKDFTRAKADKYDREKSAELYAIASRIEDRAYNIDEAVKVYLENHRHLKTFENLERELFLIRNWYDMRPMTDLAEVCKEYSTKAVNSEGKPLSPATKRNRIRYLTAACRYAWKEHRMGLHDPAEKVTVPTVDNARQHYVDRAGMLQIARKCKNRKARMAIRIAFYSGMRLSEILRAVVRKDCWLLADTKNGTPRAVPIHPKAAVCARRFRPCPKITIQRAWKVARDAAGMGHLHFHDLRHSTASELIAQDVDLYTVGKILGHKTSRSTERYAHLAVGKMTEAIGKMGKKSPKGLTK